MYNQIAVKKFYRYATLRNHLLYNKGITSGWMPKSYLYELKDVAKVTRQTMYSDIKYFIKQGWVVVFGDSIRLSKLNSKDSRMFGVFRANLESITAHPKPVMMFTLLIKQIIFKTHFTRQIKAESANIQNRGVRRQYLQRVNAGNTIVGEREGIRCSIRSTARHFGKSAMTAHRYLRDMEKNQLIGIKRNSQVVCEAKDLGGRIPEELINRIFVKKGMVYQRLCNSYTFFYASK